MHKGCTKCSESAVERVTGVWGSCSIWEVLPEGGILVLRFKDVTRWKRLRKTFQGWVQHERKHGGLEYIAKFKEFKKFKEHMRQSHEQRDQLVEGDPTGLVVHYKQGLLKSSIF